MSYIYAPVGSIIILILLFFFSRKHSFIAEDTSSQVRKIHNKKIIKIGGLCFISLLIISLNVAEINILSAIYIASLFLVIGLIADLNKNFSSYSRLILSSILGIYFIYINDLSIQNINQSFFDEFILFSWLTSFIFTLLCILFLVNGFNIIDGNNGLMLGFTLLVLANFLVHIELDVANDKDTIFLIKNLINVVSLLAIINFFTGKILSGDTGSYFLGFIIAAIALIVFNENKIDAFLLANLLFYPVTEMTLSFFRRVIILRKHPLFPDALHLHSLIFKVLENNNVFGLVKNKMIINSLTSFIILFNLLLIYIILFYNFLSLSYLSYLMLFILYYLISYLALYKLASNKKLIK